MARFSRISALEDMLLSGDDEQVALAVSEITLKPSTKESRRAEHDAWAEMRAMEYVGHIEAPDIDEIQRLAAELDF